MASAGSPLLRRLAPLLNGRIRANHRLLASSSTAVEKTSPAEPQAVIMTDNCIKRLKELHAKEPSNKGKMLRLCVEACGCSGFQYAFLLDDKKNSDDRVFEKDGAKLVVNNVSYDFVKGATVDYVENLFVQHSLYQQIQVQLGAAVAKVLSWSINLVLKPCVER